jgi:hypothetical protein
MTEFDSDGQYYVSGGDILPSADIDVPDAKTGGRVAEENHGLDCAVQQKKLSKVAMGCNISPTPQVANVANLKTAREEWDDRVERLIDQGVYNPHEARLSEGTPPPEMTTVPVSGESAALTILRRRVATIRSLTHLTDEQKESAINQVVGRYRTSEEEFHRLRGIPYTFIRPEL